MVSTYVYMYYTLCMTLVSPRCSLRREMSICTFYIRTLIASYSILFQSFPLFLEEAFVSKIVSSAATVQTPEIFYYSLRL